MFSKKYLKVVDGTRSLFLPRTMAETIKVSMSDRQKRIMHTIDNSPEWEKVKAKVKEEMANQGLEPTDEYLEEGILSLKQYYAVCFLDNNPHAISDVLDPFWHAHILHTRDYVAFGKSIDLDYMHHRPRNYANEKEVEVIKTLFIHTHEVFGKCFAYVSPLFMAPFTDESQLVCLHYNNERFVEPGDIAFPQSSDLMSMQDYLLSLA